MWLWFGIATAAPLTGQVAESCDAACTARVEEWFAASGGRWLFPPGAGRRDPEGFARLGLARWVVVPEGATAPPDGAGLELVPSGGGWAQAVPDDPDYDLQWGLHNDGTVSPGAVAGADIGAASAWDITVGTGVLAVPDSGISLSEPDLTLWENPGEVNGNGLDDDGNGYVDDRFGWDFVDDDGIPSEGSGHGTNVASIAASTGDNTTGLTGVCWACEVMALRVLSDSGFGYYTWWAEAVVYAADHGAAVINMSLGGTGTSDPLQAAVQYAVGAGVPIVVSAGNEASDQVPNFPSILPEVIAVGATDPDDRRSASFFWGGGSNWGPHLDLVAPGASIYGHPPTPGAPEYWSGTSQGTPHVAGTALLLLTLEPTLTPAEVRAYLESTAADQVGDPAEDVAGYDVYHGWGRLDAGAALAALQSDVADADGDGVDVRSGDCDDTRATVAPGLPEVCDGLDNDCDGSLAADETDDDADGVSVCDGDCDDADPDRMPGAVDTPDDGIDQDCDGVDAQGPGLESAADGEGEETRGCGCATGARPPRLGWLRVWGRR